MSRRVYIHKFLDIKGDYVGVESEKDLKDIEWEVKENKHNIEILNKFKGNNILPEADPKDDDIIYKRK